MLALVVASSSVPALRGELIISEFMASNRANLADEDGAFPDWIEIHNPDAAAVDLTGWFLTDSATNRTKWRFPVTTIAPGEYLVVFASNKNRTTPGSPLHTNFVLSGGGEYLGLIRPDGTSVAFEYAPEFPPQNEDVSYGVARRSGGGSERVYFPTPTPGAANPGLADGSPFGPVAFSHAAGIFSANFSLALSGAGAGQVIRYVLTPPGLNDGTFALPDPTSPAYAAPLTVDRSTVYRAALFAADGSVRGPIAAVNYERLDPVWDSFASRLPVLAIDTLGTGELNKDKIEYPAWMYGFPGQSGAPAPTFGSPPNLTTRLNMTVRGHTSAQGPKKSYNLSPRNLDGRIQSLPLLGLPAHERWALVTTWKFDPSYLKNAFVYALSNQMGRWAARTRFTEVFLNLEGKDLDPGTYWGLYAVTDRIETGPARVAIPTLTSADTTGSALTGGYILKIDNPEDGDYSWKTKRWLLEDPGIALVLVAPDEDDITGKQRSYLIDYVQRMEDALLADRDSNFAQRTYLEYIDRASWVDHHLLNTLVLNPDALQHSAYFTKPRDGPLQAGPVWDFDKALGLEFERNSKEWDVWTTPFGTDLWYSGWWGLIARDPEFMQDWVDRWQTLRRTTLADGNLTGLTDTLAAEVGVDAANRDAARWPDNVSLYGSYAAQIDYQKRWITQRAQWIDGQFVAPPTVTTGATNLTVRAPAGAQLIYTTDGSDPRSLGGRIAPNAVVSTQALTVAANANVHARSYRDDRKAVFPGSPWSSAVGGTASSPLRPASRVVNLSARAVVGGGEDALFAGVVVADTGGKRYLSRAVGPGLTAFGAQGVVTDPQLIIFSDEGKELFRNNGWQEGPDAALLPEYSRAAGAFALASGSKDAALASQLPAGAYTFQVSTPSGRPGVGLVELYELATNGRTANLSSRARVQQGEGVLIGGFVIEGTAYQRMLIRAVGPSLAALGIATPLVDPVLTIYEGATAVATNDRWDVGTGAAAVRAASSEAGAFPLLPNSQDAALLITLKPGAYTAKVEGKNEGVGVGLLEIYVVP